MMVGIASGTYSSIFIASPVLTAWKEREPGFARRRARIAADRRAAVPAFADEIELARLGASRGGPASRTSEPSDAGAARGCGGHLEGDAGRHGGARRERRAGRRPTRRRSSAGNATSAAANAAGSAASTGGTARWHCSSGSRWASPSGTSRSSFPTASGRASSAPSSARVIGAVVFGAIVEVVSGRGLGDTDLGTALDRDPGRRRSGSRSSGSSAFGGRAAESDAR